MAASQARSGFGTLFQRGDGATPTEAFTTVAEIVSISGPSEKAEVVDVTHMESPQGFREKLATLLDSGDVQLTMQLLPGDTSQNNLRTDLRNKTRRNFRMIVPGGQAVTFAGYVTEVGAEFPFDNKMMRNTTITVTGPQTWAPYP